MCLNKRFTAFLNIAALSFLRQSLTITSPVTRFLQFRASSSSCTIPTSFCTRPSCPLGPFAVNYTNMIGCDYNFVTTQMSNIKVVEVMTSKPDMLPGQFCKLQDSLSVLSPSHRPPFFSSTFFVLVFVLVPAPQVLEQSLICHSFHSQLTRVSMV